MSSWKNEVEPKEVVRVTARQMRIEADKMLRYAKFLEELLRKWKEDSSKEEDDE